MERLVASLVKDGTSPYGGSKKKTKEKIISFYVDPNSDTIDGHK
jgi:hypothetical protein